MKIRGVQLVSYSGYSWPKKECWIAWELTVDILQVNWNCGIITFHCQYNFAAGVLLQFMLYSFVICLLSVIPDLILLFYF